MVASMWDAIWRRDCMLFKRKKSVFGKCLHMPVELAGNLQIDDCQISNYRKT
jgi:hypothetical protein